MNAENPHVSRLRRILEEQGGLYSLEDLFAEIEAGTMQAFSEGNSTVFTSIREFPRKKVLEIRVAMGTLDEIYKIQPRVVAFAKEQGCELLLAVVGRDGWDKTYTRGWDKIASTWLRRL
jgi:hypothetical protein